MLEADAERDLEGTAAVYARQRTREVRVAERAAVADRRFHAPQHAAVLPEPAPPRTAPDGVVEHRAPPGREVRAGDEACAVGPVLEEHPTAVDEALERAAEQGTLTGRERSLILNTLALGRRTARQIMVPRVKVAYLDLRRSMDENRAVMNEYLYSRLPLCDGGMDHVIGVVPTKEFLSAYNEEGDSSVLQLIAHPPVFVPGAPSRP